MDASTWIAEAFGIPKAIVGATMVSLATALPEIIVSLVAAASGRWAMAVGNAIGSVTANTGLIFGLLSVLAPLSVRRKEYAAKGALMVLAVAGLLAFSWGGSLHPLGAVALLVFFAAFLYENGRHMKAIRQGGVRALPSKGQAARKALDFLLGVIGIVGGARLLVDHGAMLAVRFGIPEGMVAVTIIALGTCLPELVTAVAAIKKGQAALSVGNILGANIIDMTLIVPLSGLVAGQAMPLPVQSLALDLPFCLALALAAILPLLLFAKTTKRQGLILLAAYGAYLMILCSMMI